MIETTLKSFSYDRYHPYDNIELDTFVDNILFVREWILFTIAFKEFTHVV